MDSASVMKQSTPTTNTRKKMMADALEDSRNDVSNQSVSLEMKFSDEEPYNEMDRYGSIGELMKKGRKAIVSGGQISSIYKNLVQEIHVIAEKRSSEIPVYNANDEIQSVLLENWIEEVLKFLALKTITGDTTEPCQLLPGHAVGVGWKVLMMSPAVYSKVCLAMGNSNIFDHNPLDTDASSRIQEKHKIKRYNATLRAYEAYFDQHPPSLYWSFHKKTKDLDDSIVASMGRFCGFDSSFITDPFALNVEEPKKMSPTMPTY